MRTARKTASASRAEPAHTRSSNIIEYMYLLSRSEHPQAFWSHLVRVCERERKKQKKKLRKAALLFDRRTKPSGLLTSGFPLIISGLIFLSTDDSGVVVTVLELITLSPFLNVCRLWLLCLARLAMKGAHGITSVGHASCVCDDRTSQTVFSDRRMSITMRPCSTSSPAYHHRCPHDLSTPSHDHDHWLPNKCNLSRSCCVLFSPSWSHSAILSLLNTPKWKGRQGKQLKQV